MVYDPNSKLEYIYFGETTTKTHGLGDGVLLTAVVREINKKYPDKKIILRTVGPKEIYENNPRIHRVEHGVCGEDVGIQTFGIPIDSVIGGYFHLNKYGTVNRRGHFIDQKCAWFGIENADITPELFVSEKETLAAQKTLELLSGTKPVIMFCKSSTVPDREWTIEGWINIIDMLKDKYDVYQLEETIRYDFYSGMPTRIMDTIPNARQELRGLPIRKLIAIMSLSKKYLGVNTGLMPIASAFSYDNIIYMKRNSAGDASWIFPKNNHFWEDWTVEQVQELVKEKWL